MTLRAKGSFEVKLTPQGPPDAADGVALARLSIEKEFHGGIEGASRGEMLSAGTAVPGSAGYVAIERIRGTLDGRAGSFVLQHLGIMTRGAPELAITVVPDSGTGDLAGLSGKMTLDLAGGRHDYELEYSLPEVRE